MKRSLSMETVTLMICFLVTGCGAGDRGGGLRSSPAFSVGGVTSGLTGTVVLQNNDGDDLSIRENGAFTFPKGMAAGSFYNVTVRTSPAGQTCLVSNGTGTIILSNITNVTVDCFKTGGLVTGFNAPNGFTVQSGSAGGTGDDSGNAISVDSQGRILVAGSSRNSAGDSDLVVWRFNANGTLDTTFNGSGFAVHNGAAGGNADDSGNAIAVDTQGRVLVAGSSVNGAGNINMVVWRFNENGALDTTFNGSGFVVHNGAAGGNADDTGNAVTTDSQHRIVVTGSSRNIAGNTDMVIWRFNANGTLDTALGGNGIVVQNGAEGGNADDSGRSVSLDTQGRILVAGVSGNTAGNADMAVWRFTTNGALDTTFNRSGFVAHDSAAGGNADDAGNAIAVDSLGRVVVTGSSRNILGDTDMVIWRFNADGTLDTAFNGNGIVINNGAAGSNGNDAGRAITIDSQGRLLVAGSSQRSAGNVDMVLWRFNADGTLDISFAEDGIVVQNGTAGGNADDTGNAVALCVDGRILTAGSSKNSTGDADMVVWEFFP